MGDNPKKHWLHVELDALAVDIVRFSPEGRASKADIITGFNKAGAPDKADGAVKAAIERCLRAGKLNKPQRGIYEYVAPKR